MKNSDIAPAEPPMHRRAPGTLKARLRAIHGNTRGGALVEFALTLPVLLLVITGIFSFSIAIYQKLELAEAVASGGRFIASDRGDLDPCASTAAKIAAAAPTLNSANLTYSFTISTPTTAGTATGPTCTGTAGANNMVSLGTASVTATYTCSIHAYRFTFPGCSLSSTIVEEVQ